MVAENKISAYSGKWMLCSFILFSIYLLNMLLGKAILAWNLNLPLSILMGEVTEFLTLLLAIVCFSIEVLKHESLREQSH